MKFPIFLLVLCSCGTPHYNHTPEPPWTEAQTEAFKSHLSTMMWLHEETGGRFLEPGAASEYKPYKLPPTFDLGRPLQMKPGKAFPTWEPAKVFYHAPYKY